MSFYDPKKLMHNIVSVIIGLYEGGQVVFGLDIRHTYFYFSI